MKLNRREILKSIGYVALMPITGLPSFPVPEVPIHYGECSLTKIGYEAWGKLLFDYALENMQFAQLIGKDETESLLITF